MTSHLRTRRFAPFAPEAGSTSKEEPVSLFGFLKSRIVAHREHLMALREERLTYELVLATEILARVDGPLKEAQSVYVFSYYSYARRANYGRFRYLERLKARHKRLRAICIRKLKLTRDQVDVRDWMFIVQFYNHRRQQLIDDIKRSGLEV